MQPLMWKVDGDLRKGRPGRPGKKGKEKKGDSQWETMILPILYIKHTTTSKDSSGDKGST